MHQVGARVGATSVLVQEVLPVVVGCSGQAQAVGGAPSVGEAQAVGEAQSAGEAQSVGEMQLVGEVQLVENLKFHAGKNRKPPSSTTHHALWGVGGSGG